MRARKGFTLIELLIVITLMIILVTALIPQFRNFSRKSFVVEQARVVEGVIAQAQSYATSGMLAGETNYYRFQLGNEVTSYWRQLQIVQETKLGSEVVLSTEDLGCGIAVVQSDSSKTWVKFETVSGKVEHTYTGANISFRICYPNLGFVDISIDPSGGIHREDYQSDSNVCNTYTPSC